ncbi:O-antigen ligase family protein [Maribellus maritimus]|uniref:O-antigen ligase family protein n=1 Tax=Maribellus maritimus TaxID=2870838 RepID=UPI001EEB74C1|nr:O-antigen ligase family protein [Maribellus maritimus]MCG6186910.1 O-antigen ligase family protein [Maribellus maritimus]
MSHLFEQKYGNDLLTKPSSIVIIILVIVMMGLIIVKGGLIAGIGLFLLPFIVTFLYLVFMIPRTGLIAVYIANFLAIGLTRYLKGIPLGLSIDMLLFLTYISLFLMSFFKKIPWKNGKNDLVLLSAIWYLYTIFELFNPEAVSRTAWFYAMRGVSLYMLLIIPLIFILFNKKKDIDLFLKIWAILSIMGTLKGIMQKYFGVDPFEQAWLNEGNYKTHVLFGKLRVFSFYSDAGQFGASQGLTGVIFLILSFNKKLPKKTKIFYLVTSFLGFYGLMISGTRGAMAVPIMGFALYIILRKNFKVMIVGAILGLSVIIFFKYTTIGQGNYSIRRMRTAFNPTEDASYLVRRANQKKLSNYLAARPFGGGIGSAGNWGLRFTPNTFLANTPTDSWYVMIWAEQGVVGLALHLFILLYILGKSMFFIFFRIKNEEIRNIMCAFTSGYWGIMVASYGNGVLGQMPTGIVIYTCMVYMFMGPKLDKEETEKQIRQKKLNKKTKQQ